MLPFRAKRIRCLVPLAHNRSGVFGAKRLFLASMSCVKIFRSTFRAMSFQDLHWLEKLSVIWSQSGLVGRNIRHLTSTHMTLH